MRGQAFVVWPTGRGEFALEGRELCARARKNLDDSAPLADLVDPACFAVLDGLTRVYTALLHRIEARPALVVAGSPVRLSTAHKAWIAATAYAKGCALRIGAAARRKPRKASK